MTPDPLTQVLMFIALMPTVILRLLSGALMILDPLTQVLIFVALMPTTVLRFLLGPLRTRRYWRVVPTLVFLTISGLSVAHKVPPMVGFLSHWALNVWFFLITIDLLQRQTRASRQIIPILCVATFWAIEVRLIFIQGFIQTPGIVHFWFLDYFNKLVLVALEPTLISLGLEEAMPTVLHYLSGPLVFLSNHLISLHFWFSALGIYVLYRLVHPHILDASPPLPLLASRLSRTFTCLTGLLTLLHAALPEHIAINLLFQITSFWLVLRGLRVVHLSALQTSLRWVRILFWLGVIVLVLHPIMFWIPAIIAVLESFVGAHLGTRWSDSSTLGVVNRTEAVLGALRRSFRPVTFLAVVIPMSIIPYIRTTARAGESPGDELVKAAILGASSQTQKIGTQTVQGEVDEGEAFKRMIDVGQEVQTLDRSASPLWVDVFEYPNKRGKLPHTGHSPIEAERLCREEGKHLCTTEEWYDACSDAGRNLFIFPDVAFSTATKMLSSRCNLAKGLSRTSLLPSGQKDRCRTKFGAHDMIGNAFEWVRINPDGGFWGLAGSYYRYSDDQTISCPFRVVVHESQLEMVNMDAVGFRCCRSEQDGNHGIQKAHRMRR